MISRETVSKSSLIHATCNMNDRQRLSWTLQTEARVRLSKLQARDTFNFSHTLDSAFLLEIYPDVSDKCEDDNGSDDALCR